MQNIASAIKDTISISLFNRGLAGKIFEEVKKSGTKVVMKNNAAECVLLSPKEYLKLMDEVNEARLLAIANERLGSYDPIKTVSETEMAEKLGINRDDLENFDEVEIE